MISEKFKEYIFIDEEHEIFKGRMVRYRFPNGYGASVIEGEKSLRKKWSIQGESRGIEDEKSSKY